MIQGYQFKHQQDAIITSLELPPHLAFLLMLLTVSCFRLGCTKSWAGLFCMFLTVGNVKAFLTAQTHCLV